MSADDKRRRQFQALGKNRSKAYRNSYRNDLYEDSSGYSGAYYGTDNDHRQAGYRKPAGASYQRSTKRGRSPHRRYSSYAGRSSQSIAARRRAARRRRRNINIIKLILALVALLLILAGIIFGVKKLIGIIKRPEDYIATVSEARIEDTTEPETTAQSKKDRILSEANLLALQYDYDSAIELIRSDEEVAGSAEGIDAIARYEEIKSGLVEQDISKITHVFFHSLVVDEENAFNKEKWGRQADGYNQVMTTVTEFEKMLDKFYSDGFVLVGLHDMASMQPDEDGNMVMTPGKIMLPSGKKAMVMSQDDLCYYEYMEGAGFADRIIVGDDGKPTCVYTAPDGSEITGDYDLVPILDRFVEEHPDFSYRGAKACLAFTGYNGILGYRTDETYDPDSDMYDSEKKANENIEADRETARQVISCLKDAGYELASHSWGHKNYTDISYDHMKRDADRWDKNVNKELMDGECDIILFPFGADVGDWHMYTHDNAKFDYLWDLGFRYFCNVDSSQYWVQLGKDYMRQGRRNLDGYAMWNDIANGKNRLSDLFDAAEIFSDKRPTPVPGY